MDQQFNENDLFFEIIFIHQRLAITISPLQNVFTQLNDLTTNETPRTLNIDDIMSIDSSDFKTLNLSFNIQQRIKTIKRLLCVSPKLGRALV
jgi:hypothetical protein